MVADINRSAADIIETRQWLADRQLLREQIDKDISSGTDRLNLMVGNADGFQLSDDDLNSARHFSNVLFNIMRGGIYENDYGIKRTDLLASLKRSNRNISQKHKAFLKNLPETIQISDLIKRCAEQDDPNLIRLCYEYLPLTFSRRHGDPSRPWTRRTGILPGS